MLFKSNEIKKNFPDCKVQNQLFSIFLIPIYYTGPECDSQIITPQQHDVHLKKNGNFIHRIFDSGISHHINGNEYDNQPSNLIQIILTPEEQKHFGSDYTITTKHQNLHILFNDVYRIEHYYLNTIDLKQFQSENSIYKIFIKQHLNDPIKMQYEMKNSFVKRSKIPDLNDFKF